MAAGPSKVPLRLQTPLLGLAAGLSCWATGFICWANEGFKDSSNEHSGSSIGPSKSTGSGLPALAPTLTTVSVLGGVAVGGWNFLTAVLTLVCATSVLVCAMLGSTLLTLRSAVFSHSASADSSCSSAAENSLSLAAACACCGWTLALLQPGQHTTRQSEQGPWTHSCLDRLPRQELVRPIIMPMSTNISSSCSAFCCRNGSLSSSAMGGPDHVAAVGGASRSIGG